MSTMSLIVTAILCTTVTYLLPLASSLVSSKCTPDVALDVNLTLGVPADFITCAAQISHAMVQTNPDIGKTTDEIITSHGYDCEIYDNVTTDDGYILTVQRIPNPGKTPVFLQHGLGGCSDNWLLAPVEKSLAFLLWNAGYDVWLGNFRGTSYSLGHKTLNWNDPNNFSYWDFSWHEMGKFDIPAVLNFITNITNMPKLYYIGHSMGTTSFMVALDQVPDLINGKVLTAFFLSPGGFMGRSPCAFRLLAPLSTAVDPKYLDPVFKGRVENPDQMLDLMNTTLAKICTPTAVRCTACQLLIFAIFGIDAPQTNYSLVPNLPDRFPNIISVKTLFHYGQSMELCTFRQFDYGPDKNMEVYGASTPPDYSLTKCRVPIYSYFGNYDNIFRPKDVKRTTNLIPAEFMKEVALVNSTYFNHIDFLMAKDIVTLLYAKIISILGSLTSS